MAAWRYYSFDLLLKIFSGRLLNIYGVVPVNSKDITSQIDDNGNTGHFIDSASILLTKKDYKLFLPICE